jgi:phytoene dehydrogenase-like protein
MPEKRYYKGSRDGKRPSVGDPLAGVRARYDVVVVGSGLAGLTAANVLGKLGRKVALFEQHYNLGGLATWFKRRGGHVFDISLHGFPFGMVKTCRRHWNRAIAERIVRLPLVRFDNPQFQLDTDYTRADFSRLLVEAFKVERERVERFFAHLAAMSFYDDPGATVGELFEQHFPGRDDVHRLLLEPIAYANGSTLSDPAIAYGIVFSNFMNQGIYTFSGGTDLLVRQMKAELESNGVELFHDAQVQRIAVEDRSVRGVAVNGRFVEAPAVISNAGLKQTVLELVGERCLRPEFAERVRAVRQNNSSCQVYMGLSRGAALAAGPELIFSSERERFSSEALCDFHGQSRTFSFYYPKTRPGSDRHAVVCSTNANWSDWSALGPDEYEDAKARLCREAVAGLERYHPGAGARLEHVEAATPRTFAFYTQHWQGSSFGTKFEGLRPSLELSGEIQGLYHAGSVGIIMSGWLGAANYGVITANKVDAWLAGATLAPVLATP